MSVLLVAGSPTEHSRSAALLEVVQQKIKQQAVGRHVSIDRISIRNLSPQALLLADWNHPGIRHTLAQVEAASVLVIATPVYKAAYSGVLKVFLDLLPQTGLKNKVVLPLATGGSPNHMLALDYALRPVLQSLGAKHILPGVYATDQQIPKGLDKQYVVDEEIQNRLDEAVAALIKDGLPVVHRPHFEPVPFSAVQYSV